MVSKVVALCCNRSSILTIFVKHCSSKPMILDWNQLPFSESRIATFFHFPFHLCSLFWKPVYAPLNCSFLVGMIYEEAVMMNLYESEWIWAKVRDNLHLGVATPVSLQPWRIYPLCSIVYRSEPHNIISLFDCFVF